MNFEMLKVYDSRLKDIITELHMVAGGSILPKRTIHRIELAVDHITNARAAIFDDVLKATAGTKIKYASELVPPACEDTQVISMITAEGVIIYYSGMSDTLEVLKDHIVNNRARVLPS